MDEDDGLSPEDLANIARLSMKHVYRAYFDIDSGQVLAISNEDRPEYDYSIVISYDQYDAFTTGKEQFKDWAIITTKNPDNEYGVELVRKEFQGLAFRNHMFEWISEEPTEDTELTVHWDEFNQQWIFIISDFARQQFYDKKITTQIIKIFVTLENDLDFLIRTIDLNIQDLIVDKVVVPFETKLESEIDKLSVSSRTVFDSYGLKVWKIK